MIQAVHRHPQWAGERHAWQNLPRLTKPIQKCLQWQVKQIVGGTLKDDSKSLVTNFEASQHPPQLQRTVPPVPLKQITSTRPSSWFAERYRDDGLGLLLSCGFGKVRSEATGARSKPARTHAMQEVGMQSCWVLRRQTKRQSESQERQRAACCAPSLRTFTGARRTEGIPRRFTGSELKLKSLQNQPPAFSVLGWWRNQRRERNGVH